MTAPLPQFVDLVRDALLHIYDVGHLQTHPLLALVADRETGAAPTGSRLRQQLLDAIEAVRPGADVAPTARVWRLHHILESRYIECHDVAEVMDQVALSSAQYHREHQRALHMVATVLWEQWQAGSRGSRLAGSAPRKGPADPVRQEVEGMVHEAHAGAVDLTQVIDELRLLLRPLVAGRAVDLRLEAPAHPVAVAGERVVVRQSLLVLLSRAVSAVEQGTIELRVTHRPRQVVVTISGPAMHAADQLELGLAESRPFVDALRGAVRDVSAAAPARRWTVEICLRAHEQPTLLVVDNNADFHRLVELYLTGSEWKVVGATAVEDAIRAATQRLPTVVLLDVIIPGRDGWDLLLELRNHAATHDIPVIVCSVLHEPQMATALGATGYLQKPVSHDQLLAALESFR